MLKSQAPKVLWDHCLDLAAAIKSHTCNSIYATGGLWDHCLELAAAIKSHTCNSIYATGGEVPETIMLGSTAVISTVCQFAWYDWVMFRDTAPTFPDDTHVLGRYLGPAIDIGPATTVKILKSNGQIVFRSTLRHLTPDKLTDPAHFSLRRDFDVRILTRLGSLSTVDDFPALDLTPDPDADHADDDDPPLGDNSGATPTLEVGDNYISSKLLFPRNGTLAKGKVTARK